MRANLDKGSKTNEKKVVRKKGGVSLHLRNARKGEEGRVSRKSQHLWKMKKVFTKNGLRTSRLKKRIIKTSSREQGGDA